MDLDAVLDHYRAHLLGCRSLAHDIAVALSRRQVGGPEGFEEAGGIRRTNPHCPLAADSRSASFPWAARRPALSTMTSSTMSCASDKR